MTLHLRLNKQVVGETCRRGEGASDMSEQEIVLNAIILVTILVLVLS